MQKYKFLINFTLLVGLIACIQFISCGSSPTEPIQGPGKISDLQLIVGMPTSAYIIWTAPPTVKGSEAVSYEMRYSTEPIRDSESWYALTKVENLPTPTTGGITESFLLEGLEPNTSYYTMVRVSGVFGSISDYSNQISISTADTVVPSAFTALDLYGVTHSTTEFLGEKLVLVNFWGVWCSWCRVEMPDLIKVHDKFVDSGLVVVGYNYGDSPATALTYAEEVQLPWMNLIVDADIARNYSISVFPTTIFLDSTGKQIGKLRGAQSYETFETAVNYLLNR